jgi:hypothetical protein
MPTNSQNKYVLNLLKRGETLSNRQAILNHDIGRLSSIIKRLRDSGHEIKTKMVPNPPKTPYGVYYMPKNKTNEGRK